MRLSSKSLAAIILVVLFGGISFASVTGWWVTELTKQAATFSDGEFAGLPNPADIRGSYTFGDVENNFKVPAAILAQAFGVSSDDPAAFEVKDLESTYADQEFEIETTSVRFFVALYTGLPYEIVEDVYLPKRAAEMLKSQATLTAEQVAYLDAHTVILKEMSAPVPGTDATIEPESGEDRTLKGKTTFQEVLDWGIPQETLENLIGGKLPSSLTKVKDYCTEKGLNFKEICPSIQAEIDKVAP